MKPLKLLFLASLIWLVVELSEIGLMATSTVPLLMKTLTHLLLAVGIWALVSGAGNRGLATAAAAIGTAGHLISAYPPLQIFRSYDPDLLLLVRENTLFFAGALAVAVSFLLFGLALRNDSELPSWAPTGLMLGAVIVAVATWLGWPLWLVNLANVLTCLSVFAVCSRRLPAPANPVEAS